MVARIRSSPRSIAATGDVRWKTERNTTAAKKFSFSTPIVIEVDGQKQVISPGSGFVAAYDPRDGHEIWRVRYGEGYSVVPCPVYAHGLLFVASGYDKADPVCDRSQRERRAT